MKNYIITLVLLGASLCNPVLSPQEELLFKAVSPVTREEANLNKLLSNLRAEPLGEQESAGSFRNQHVAQFIALEGLETKLHKRYEGEIGTIEKALTHADVNARDDKDRSSLEIAILNNKPVRVVELLLDSGIEVTTCDKEIARRQCLLDRERGIFLERNSIHATQVYLGAPVRSSFNPIPRSCSIYAELRDLPEHTTQKKIEKLVRSRTSQEIKELIYLLKTTEDSLSDILKRQGIPIECA
jgi:hypothetical protein